MQVPVMLIGRAFAQQASRIKDTAAGTITYMSISQVTLLLFSCWAFSATEQLESDAIRTSNYWNTLSPNQPTSCTYGRDGCQGGWPVDAMLYVQGKGGIETEYDYPYDGNTFNGHSGSCNDWGNKAVYVSQVYRIQGGEGSMAYHVQTTGTLSICLNAQSWGSYTGGIMYNCAPSGGHCVQAVGVLTDGPEPFWKVRNSWGPDWGEGGFIRLAYGRNTCQLTTDSTFADVYPY